MIRRLMFLSVIAATVMCTNLEELLKIGTKSKMFDFQYNAITILNIIVIGSSLIGIVIILILIIKPAINEVMKNEKRMTKEFLDRFEHEKKK